MLRYSALALLRESLNGHRGWARQWADAVPKPRYDVVIVGAGLIIGTLLYYPLSQGALGGIALNLETGAVIFWSGLVLTLGLVSSLVAARRVLAIDPIEATTGQGVGSGSSRSPTCAAGPDAFPRQR